MRQLTALDTTFLHMDADRNVGHVGSLVVVDPGTAPGPVNADTIREFIGARLHLLEPLRWRLAEVPMNIDRPWWVDDPDVDLTYHVKGTALPAPGNERQLAEQVARIATRKLDRQRPLWEVYVIEGLEGGRVGVYTKLHHAAIDGKSGMKIMSTLLDTDPAGRPVPPAPTKPSGEHMPTDMELLTRSWLGLVKQPTAAMGLMGEWAKEVQRMAPLWAGLGDAALGQAARHPHQVFGLASAVDRDQHAPAQRHAGQPAREL
ncbi:MAG: wax ester/triacylglycerol synthase family O-acyltransferase, partial [Actinomycetia bacterium]|nr:wax ester/triacylglycerol synthase family O-acyltransferase [Actinomycetes bacterium]